MIADVRSEIEALKARLIVEQLEQANAPVRPSSAVLSQPAQQLAPRQTATYPPWYPPAPSVVVKTIREQALAENKDNYSGANYEIERQTEAFDKLIRWQKMANPLINGLIAKAAFENGTKYSMIAYEVERQLEAKQRLDGK